MTNGFGAITNGDDYLPDILNAPPTYDATQGDGGKSYVWAKRVASGTADSQPDLFYYTLPTQSGKFYTDQHRQIHPIPFTAIKIEPLLPLGTGGFKIADEQGRIYTFDRLEWTSLPNGCGPDQYHDIFAF